MIDETGTLVTGIGGLRGRLLSPPEDTVKGKVVRVLLEDGRQLAAPGEMLLYQSDGSFSLLLSSDQINEAAGAEAGSASRIEPGLVVPVIEERLNVSTRVMEIGRTRIIKHVNEREEVVDTPLLKQEVVIDRMPINRVWEGPPPAARYEGNTLIVPLLEEVIVVEKRVMLKEELHIRRVQKTVREPQTVTLRTEEATVDRVEPTAAGSAHGVSNSPVEGRQDAAFRSHS